MSSTQTEIILNRIYAAAAEQRAAEIYLISAQAPFMRINGVMLTMPNESILATSTVEGIIDSLLSKKEQEELEETKQIRIVKAIGKLGDAQLNVYFQKGVPAIQMKLLTQEIVNLNKLGLPKMVINFTNLQEGIVFITGPRDSGRSTLAASLIDYINKTQSKLIATLEKPIKHNIIGAKSVIEQREIGKDVPSFLEGLESVRRRNVDVLLISEIPDYQCLTQMFAIAEAGTLIFTVMDTSSAEKTIKRLLNYSSYMDQVRARYFLSENLGGIIATRLVPAIRGGRVRALEVLPGMPSVRTILAEDKLHQLSSILQAGDKSVSFSLEQYLASLVAVEKITSESALEHCADKEIMQSLLRHN